MAEVGCRPSEGWSACLREIYQAERQLPGGGAWLSGRLCKLAPIDLLVQLADERAYRYRPFERGRAKASAPGLWKDVASQVPRILITDGAFGRTYEGNTCSTNFGYLGRSQKR